MTPRRRRRDDVVVARAMDDLARHREALGLPPGASATPGDVRRAFTETARRVHPDAGTESCAARFRAAVVARDALLASGRATRTFTVSVERRGAPARAFAAVVATPFVVAALVSLALPKQEGRLAGMGRVHGVMNAPVNAWLKVDTREPGDGNKERWWLSGRVNPKPSARATSG